MKTKGEIEVIADKLYGEYAGYHKASFVNGYTQCQLDMVKDVEYWQSESDHWYQQAMSMPNELKQVDIICPKCKGINEYFTEKNGDYKCAYTDCEHKFKQTRLI